MTNCLQTFSIAFKFICSNYTIKSIQLKIAVKLVYIFLEKLEIHQNCCYACLVHGRQHLQNGFMLLSKQRSAIF